MSTYHREESVPILENKHDITSGVATGRGIKMANLQNVLMKKRINGVLTSIYPQTVAEQVLYTNEEGTQVTLKALLADMLVAITNAGDETSMKEYIDGAVNTLRETLIGGSPEEFDTFKEAFDAFTQNTEALEALQTMAAGKVSIEEGKSLVADTLITALSALNTSVLSGIDAETVAKWNEAQANVIESITHNGEKLAINNKDVAFTSARVLVASEEPDDMNDADLLLQIV